MANLPLKLLLTGIAIAGGNKGLNELFRLTAAAFGQEGGKLPGSSRRDRLRHYAAFTRRQAEKAMAEASAPAVRKALYENARRLGGDIRARLPIRDQADAAAALRCLYRLLAIDMAIGADGAVTVKCCFFAAHYSPDVCRFISALDEGLVAGISGGQLVFSSRLTEGAERCLARIEWPESENG